jgi:hypothetical protein
MPIRLNLLAEAQAIEEMRRRNPVKRAIWVAALLVAIMLAWSSLVQVAAMTANSKLGGTEAKMNALTNEYQAVMVNQKKTEEIKEKLTALHQLATNRFLQAILLNALQQTTVEDVQLARIRTEQTYALAEASKPRTNSIGTVLPGKPATVTERIVLTLEGTDSSANPGDQVNRFKEALASINYFRQTLGNTNGVNLKNMSQPQLLPAVGSAAGKASVQFTLEARYPEKTR